MGKLWAWEQKDWVTFLSTPHVIAQQYRFYFHQFQTLSMTLFHISFNCLKAVHIVRRDAQLLSSPYFIYKNFISRFQVWAKL